MIVINRKSTDNCRLAQNFALGLKKIKVTFFVL